MAQGIGMAMQGAGTLLTASEQRAAGKAQRKAKYFEATQIEQVAGQTQAASHLAAQEEMRKSQILQSRALAIAGASGAGASDANVMKIISDLGAEGELASRTVRANANEEARKMRIQAAIARYEGDQAKRAGNISGLTTLLSSASSMIQGSKGGK